MGRPDPAIYSKVLKYSVLPLKKTEICLATIL